MMPSSTHGDPQLGIDIHLCFVPFPCPLPSLHLSVVFDPFDYLPFIGATVEIAGMKRANAGTGGVDIHIPPGFPFAPLFPNWDDELFMGSSTVLADSDPLSYTALPVLGCQVLGMPSPPRLKKRGLRMRLLPTEVNLAIPKTVYVGGSPTISLMGMAMRAGFKLAARGVFAGLGKLAKSRAGQWLGRAFKRGRQKLFKNMKPGFLKCKVFRAEPVNILTGEVSIEQSDFTLPGRIPIEWVRSYASNQRRKGACGVGWETPADGRLEFDLTDGSVIFHYPDEGPAFFPQRPEAEGDEAAVLELIDGALLSDHGDEWRVRTKSDLIYHFPKSLAWTAEEDLEEAPLGRISDLCGNWLEFQRRGSRLVAIRESAERYLRFEYDNDFINTITLYVPASDFTHTFVNFKYDQTGDLTAVSDALGNPYTFFYDDHYMVRHTNRIGLSFHYEYDKSGENWQVIHSWGDEGLYDYHFTYWPEIHETRITDSLGHTATIKSDEIGLPIMEIDPLGGRTIFEYDEAGRTTAVVDPANHRTEYLYDDRGNLLQLIQPDGSRITAEFDKHNKPKAITQPNGAIWRQVWNEQGLMLRQTSPLGATTTCEYDRTGSLTSVTEGESSTTYLSYDFYGYTTSVIDPLGNTTRVVLDDLGNVVQRFDPQGNCTNYSYDGVGRLVDISLPNDAHIRAAYDAQDNIIYYENENGDSVHFEIFGQDLVKKRTLPDGHTIEYHYDTEEQLIGITNQRDEHYKLNLDALGQIIEEIDYWGQVTKYQFDAAGYPKRCIDPLGRVIDFTTDKLGRICHTSFVHPDDPNKLFEESYEYDAIDNIIACKNNHTEIQRQFDVEGRLIEERQGDFVIRNRYDTLGRRVARETSNGTTVSYGYDLLGQVKSIGINDKPPLLFEWNSSGQIDKEMLEPDLQRHYDHDEEGRLTRLNIKHKSEWLTQNQYSYDAAGNLIQRNSSLFGKEHYRYDQLGQIVEHIDQQNNTIKYTHDPFGDQLQTRIIQQAAYHIAGGGEVPGEWYREGRFQGAYYRFDRAGNLIERSLDREQNKDISASKTCLLDWDANQRLVRSSSNGVEAKYGYDPLGRRIFKQANGQTTRFYWDDDLLAAEEIYGQTDACEVQPSAAAPLIHKIYEYLFYPSTYTPLAILESTTPDNEIYYYCNDPNSCPVQLLSSKGEVVWAAKYNVWGKAELLPQSKAHNPLRLQGQYLDEETGMHYNYFRYYDYQIGQFISQDPIGLEGGINPYQFARNTLTWVDPLGLARHTMSGQIRRNGRIVPGSRARVTSGGLQNNAADPYGLQSHTERKYLRSVMNDLEPGDVVHMRGTLDPCQSGCQPFIRQTVHWSNTTAIYRATNSQTTWIFRRALPGEFGNKFADVVQEVRQGGKTIVKRRYWYSPRKGKWRSAKCK